MLPIVEPDRPASCDGCGVCCTHLASPGYARFFPAAGGAGPAIPDHLADHPDAARAAALPAELRDRLAAFYADPDAARRPGPCLWYDPAGRRCRHYDHRPQVCRDFALGGGECLDTRRWAASVGRLPTAPGPADPGR